MQTTMYTNTLRILKQLSQTKYVDIPSKQVVNSKQLIYVIKII